MLRKLADACKCLRTTGRPGNGSQREERQEREGEVGFLQKAPKTADLFSERNLVKSGAIDRNAGVEERGRK
jgi:hypothetical protein